MILLLFIFVLFFGIILKFKNENIKIKWRTFKEKGGICDRGNFGVYCYNGAQGKGKTYSLTEYVYDNPNNIYYSNFHFTRSIGTAEIHYYRNGFEELMKLKKELDNGNLQTNGKQLVIIYDELFQELMRGDKLSKEVLDFLSQMRKRKIIFLTSAQYWSEIPITFRRFVRYQIDCNIINKFLFIKLPKSILIKTFHDGDLIKWDNDSQDFISPIIETTITKIRQNVFDSYNTFELVKVGSVVNTLTTETSTSPTGETGGKKNTDLHTTTISKSVVSGQEKDNLEFWGEKLNEKWYEKC